MSDAPHHSKLLQETDLSKDPHPTFIDCLPYALAWLDQNWNIIEANSEYRRLFSTTLPPYLKLQNQFGPLLEKSAEPIRSECSWETLSNGTCDFKIDLRKSSQHPGILFTAIDISEERERARDLEKTRAKVMGSVRLAVLSEMAAGVAHEVNNPLTIIQGLSHQLITKEKSKTLDPDFLIAKLEKILQSSSRISKVIQGLRAFARDTENEPFELAPVKDIVEDTMSLCLEKIRKQGINITLPEAFPEVQIECLPTQISQVILSLLNNSCDAVQNLEEKWSRLELQATTHSLEISVTDSGPGIAKEIREKILLPFFTTKEVGLGIGLGLSISKGIVEQHQGVLKLDRDSQFTRFVVLLPLLQRTEPAFRVRHTA
jgi:C4-dicarboxylate-specific signal transduction histidine kinase